ncbi:hypothetical protein [Patulibacter defluvii]|uniref:hypothetical protein n=1 Tax=Patulibacter defluvii TaxID=3095358 RepID=UPI002A764999|nr:hypothetical protein [Patulibacter sp. DM4]
MLTSLSGGSRPTPARSRTLTLLLLLATAATPALAAPAGASAMAKGLADEVTARGDDAGLRREFFQVAKDANVSFARTFLHWDAKHHFPFPHEVASIRRMATEGAAAGIDTLFISFNGELGTRYKTDARKVSLNGYRKFVRKSVAALKGLPVKLVWSPWNESNYQTQLPKKHGPEVWRKMQNIAYEEVKKQTPKALVVAGELAPYARSTAKSSNPGPFLREALGLDKNWRARKGTKAKDYAIKADAFTIHSYDYKNNPTKRLRSNDMWTIRNLATQRNLLKRAARTKRIPGTAIKRLYITEFAYIFKVSSQTIPDTTAATWLQSAWDIAAKNGIRGLLWFNVRDPKAIFFSGLKDEAGNDRAVLPVFTKLK